jgi:nitrate reductase NapE component
MSDQNEVKSSPSRIKLWIVFVSVYSLGLLGSLSNEWKDSGINKLWNPEFSTFDQLENLSDRIFSLAGFIDIFLFPSLASSILITISVMFYRKFAAKLKNSRLKPLLAVLFVVIAFFVWSLLSVLIVVATS